MNLSETIDIVDNIDPKEFHEKYLIPQKPLIIKGLSNNTTAKQKWSLDYFMRTMGDIEVDILDNGNKKEFYIGIYLTGSKNQIL